MAITGDHAFACRRMGSDWTGSRELTQSFELIARFDPINVTATRCRADAAACNISMSPNCLKDMSICVNAGEVTTSRCCDRRHKRQRMAFPVESERAELVLCL